MTADPPSPSGLSSPARISLLTAAISVDQANNDLLVFEGDELGGQLALTTDVANYTGFPDGIGGHELVNNIKE